MPPIPNSSELLRRARNAVPEAHREPPQDGDTAPDPFHKRSVLEARIHDWAFYEGWSFIRDTADKKNRRVIYLCKQHGDETRNTRKTKEEDRLRPNTKISQQSCKVRITIKGGDNGWNYRIPEIEHSHDPHPDPLLLPHYRDRQPGYTASAALQRGHLGHITYNQSVEIVKAQGLKPLRRKEYYNLRERAEKGELLTEEDEYNLIIQTVHDADLRLRIRYVYTVDHQGNRKKKIPQDIFFCSSTQILLAKRFVSEFAYVTDATFGTNRRRLPLIILTGIAANGHTFEFGYMFIVSESANAFKFLRDVLTELIFHDCPFPRTVIGDFAKGLLSVYGLIDAAAGPVSSPESSIERATENEIRVAEGLENALQEAFESTAEREGETEQSVVCLQLCEWHAVSAQMRHYVASGYPKDTRTSIRRATWYWIKETDHEKVPERREELYDLLKPKEVAYLKKTYLPKERLFQRASTRLFPNLGMNSSQRGESKHRDVKSRGLNRNLPLYKAVSILIGQAREVAEKYEDSLNAEFSKTSRLIDRKVGFRHVAQNLPIYCLEMVQGEWLEAQKLAEDIRIGSVESWVVEGEYLQNSGCMLACELPLRYGLPCRHWMHQFCKQQPYLPLPLSLFHPRWHKDNKSWLSRPWKMSYSVNTPPRNLAPVRSREEADAFRGHGDHKLGLSTIAASKFLEELTGQDADEFSAYMSKGMDHLAKGWQQKQAQKANVPVVLPVNEKNQFSAPSRDKRKLRALTGLDLAEQAERAQSRERREQERRTQHSQPARILSPQPSPWATTVGNC